MICSVFQLDSWVLEPLQSFNFRTREEKMFLDVSKRFFLTVMNITLKLRCTDSQTILLIGSVILVPRLYYVNAEK